MKRRLVEELQIGRQVARAYRLPVRRYRLEHLRVVFEPAAPFLFIIRELMVRRLPPIGTFIVKASHRCLDEGREKRGQIPDLRRKIVERHEGRSERGELLEALELSRLPHLADLRVCKKGDLEAKGVLEPEEGLLRAQIGEFDDHDAERLVVHQGDIDRCDDAVADLELEPRGVAHLGHENFLPADIRARKAAFVAVNPRSLRSGGHLLIAAAENEPVSLIRGGVDRDRIRLELFGEKSRQQGELLVKSELLVKERLEIVTDLKLALPDLVRVDHKMLIEDRGDLRGEKRDRLHIPGPELLFVRARGYVEHADELSPVNERHGNGARDVFTLPPVAVKRRVHDLGYEKGRQRPRDGSGDSFAQLLPRPVDDLGAQPVRVAYIELPALGGVEHDGTARCADGPYRYIEEPFQQALAIRDVVHVFERVFKVRGPRIGYRAILLLSGRGKVADRFGGIDDPLALLLEQGDFFFVEFPFIRYDYIIRLEKGMRESDRRSKRECR